MSLPIFCCQLCAAYQPLTGILQAGLFANLLFFFISKRLQTLLKRLLLLLATMAFHAFFGLAIMSNTGLMLADWYGAMGRTWGPTPMEDQQSGGGIAWSVGEVPSLILAITLAIQWSRSDTKEQKRLDRHADRTGDAELNEYNEQLARIAARDAQREAQGRP